jgi:hypothetical protein
MFKRVGKYIAKKITNTMVGKALRWGFWSVILICPVAIVGTVGVPALAVTAIVVHSGVIEYTTTSLIFAQVESNDLLQKTKDQDN